MPRLRVGASGPGRGGAACHGIGRRRKIYQRLTWGGRIYYPEARKVSTIEASIAGEETVGGDQCVRPDQEIGRDSIAPASARAVSPPGLRGFGCRLFCHWGERGRQLVHR